MSDHAPSNGRADEVVHVLLLGGDDVVQMGADIDQRLSELRARRLPPDLDFAKVNDLPRQVDDLVMNFVDNLWQAVVVVLLVAFRMFLGLFYQPDEIYTVYPL